MPRIKTFPAIAAMICALSGSAVAGSMISDLYAQMSAPTQAAFFQATEMEPPPSGQYILEGLTIGGRAEFTHIAGDGAGGAFVALPDGRVFLISSEGEADGIAPDLDTAIRISAGLSSLFDALRFVRGNKAVDRAAFLSFEAQWGLSALPGSRIALQASGLKPLKDPFGALHDHVMANRDVKVVHPNGAFVSFAR